MVTDKRLRQLIDASKAREMEQAGNAEYNGAIGGLFASENEAEEYLASLEEQPNA